MRFQMKYSFRTKIIIRDKRGKDLQLSLVVAVVECLCEYFSSHLDENEQRFKLSKKVA